VRSVAFQPVTHWGRHVARDPLTRLTNSGVLHATAEHQPQWDTWGELQLVGGTRLGSSWSLLLNLDPGLTPWDRPAAHHLYYVFNLVSRAKNPDGILAT
jgi:hypothetical protein